MNAGESQPFFIDSNIWLYRFIVNCSDPNAIPKQQIATNITNQENLMISTQVVNEVCSNWLFWFLCGNEVYTDSFFRRIVLKVLPDRYFTIL